MRFQPVRLRSRLPKKWGGRILTRVVQFPAVVAKRRGADRYFGRLLGETAVLAALHGDETKNNHYHRNQAPLSDIHCVEYPVNMPAGFVEIEID